MLSPGPHMRGWLGEALPGQASFVLFLWAPKRIRRHQDVFPCRSWARRCSAARCSVSPPCPLPCLQLGSVGTAQAGAHKGCCVQAGTPRALTGPIAVSWEIIPLNRAGASSWSLFQAAPIPRRFVALSLTGFWTNIAAIWSVLHNQSDRR